MKALGKKVVCGQCKQPLPKPGSVIEFSPEQTNTLIQESSLPILLEFYSTMCVHCQMMHTIVHDLAERQAGELMVLQVDVDKHAELAASFAVQGVPTFIILHKGFERARNSGGMAEADFSLWVANHI
jgi:thioredoxin-like negative regulator of GroEL